MGLRKRLRKIIPREVRDNPALAIVAVAVIGPAALGALGASTASIIGATVAANTAAAVAIGTGVVTAGVTYAQGGSVSDSLKAGVLSGAGSYAGSVVSNSVSNAVSNATGAPLGGGISGTVTPSGQFASTAGGAGFGATGAATGLQTAANAGQILGVANPTFAGFLAGNVAGRATEAAITGRPIEQAALYGAAQSVGFGLDRLPDFKELPKPVQDVLVSSAQAAVMGQDVGDAVIESLIKSTNIVGNAIKQVSGGAEFVSQNPVVTKYIVNSLSSALAAQLQGKEISDTVLESLVRTTASVLQEKFNDAQLADDVKQSNTAYNQAQEEEQNIQRLVSAWEQEQQKYAPVISSYESALASYNMAIESAQNNANLAQYYANEINSPDLDRIYGANAAAQRESLLSSFNYYNDATKADNNLIKDQEVAFKDAERELRRSGFVDAKSRFDQQIGEAVSRYEGLVAQLDQSAQNLTQNSADLFTDFETELATTLAPLTAFEETDVTDQDLLAEISPVAPPTELAQGPVVDQDLLNQIQEVAARPDVGVPTDATELAQATAPTQIDISGVGGTERFRQGTQSIFEYPDGRLIVFDDNNPDGREISYAEYEDITGSPYKPVGGLQIDITTGKGISEGQVGAGTGTPGAPAIDLGAQAPVEVVDPAFTIGFDLRDYGPGSLLAPNVALFEIGGGRGTPGGTSVETTFSLVSRNTRTGQEIYDVGGKQYSLVVLPDKQVLVPEEPSEVIVFIERDQETNLPKMKEVPFTQVPPQDAEQIVAKVEQTAGGAPTGAEGAVGKLTAETPTTKTPAEQLQPGVRPEEVISGEPSEPAAPSFPDLISGITEPTMPAPVPGADAGFEDALQAPGAGGVGDEITDEDIIRIIQGEMGEAGGGEGEGLPGEEGAGPGEGEEGAGPGAGEEGEGEGAGGEGEGTGEGVGPGTGEGGTPETQLPQPSPDIVPTITTVGRRTFDRPAEGAPYRVTGMDESGILGRKQPLFGGDEDLQRAEWNRRSLRLRRLLGL
jgi:hypothetical protein